MLPNRQEEKQKERDRKNELSLQVRDEVITELLNLDNINKAVQLRGSVLFDNQAISLAEGYQHDLLSQDGKWIPQNGGQLKKEVIADLYKGNAKLSDQDKIILDAVAYDVESKFIMRYIEKVMATAMKTSSDGKIMPEQASQIDAEKAFIADAAKLAVKDVVPSLRTYLINNSKLHPKASSFTNLTEYLSYVQDKGIWKFEAVGNSNTKAGSHSRIFNDCPTPPYLKSLLIELKEIIKDPNHLEENLQILMRKILIKAYDDLFDSSGNIHAELAKILPTADMSKNTLLNAYLTSLVGESIAPLLNEKESRKNAYLEISEMRKGTQISTPIISFINITIENKNSEIKTLPFDEIKEQVATAKKMEFLKSLKEKVREMSAQKNMLDIFKSATKGINQLQKKLKSYDEKNTNKDYIEKFIKEIKSIIDSNVKDASSLKIHPSQQAENVFYTRQQRKLNALMNAGAEQPHEAESPR